VFKFYGLHLDVLPVFARGSAVFHGGQLHVDVLRGTALAHGSSGGVRQRRERDALVLRHRLGRTCRTHHPVCLVEEQFRGHRTVSAPTRKSEKSITHQLSLSPNSIFLTNYKLYINPLKIHEQQFVCSMMGTILQLLR